MEKVKGETVFASAVTAAHDATGVWFDYFALMPEELLQKITDHPKNSILSFYKTLVRFEYAD